MYVPIGKCSEYYIESLCAVLDTVKDTLRDEFVGGGELQNVKGFEVSVLFEADEIPKIKITTIHWDTTPQPADSLGEVK